MRRVSYLYRSQHGDARSLLGLQSKAEIAVLYCVDAVCTAAFKRVAGKAIL